MFPRIENNRLTPNIGSTIPELSSVSHWHCSSDWSEWRKWQSARESVAKRRERTQRVSNPPRRFRCPLGRGRAGKGVSKLLRFTIRRTLNQGIVCWRTVNGRFFLNNFRFGSDGKSANLVNNDISSASELAYRKGCEWIQSEINENVRFLDSS